LVAPERAVKRGVSHRFRPLAALAATSLLVGAVLRTTLWWQYGTADGVGAELVPSLLARGVLNDLVVTLYAFTPFAIYLALVPDRWYGLRANRLLIAALSWAAIFAMIFLAVVEDYFFREFDARFNLVAFDYLAYPTEVAGDIWTEYPVVRTVLAAALLASAVVAWMRRWIFTANGIRA
jgi:hypothetical protein